MSALGDTLYILFMTDGDWGRQAFAMASSTDGVNWKLPQKREDYLSTTERGIALTTFKDKLYATYLNDQGFPTAACWTPATGWQSAFGPYAGDRPLNADPKFKAYECPSITTYENKLFVAFTTREGKVCVTSSPDGVTWSPPVMLGATGFKRTPCILGTHCRLYIALTRDGDDMFCLTGSPDGVGWAAQPDVFPGVTLGDLPALAQFDQRLILAVKAHDDRYCPHVGQVSRAMDPNRIADYRWMREMKPFLADKRLCDIIIPGTHDSATYGITSHSDVSPEVEWYKAVLDYLSPLLFAAWAVAQNDNIGIQLGNGIRYLDLRVAARGEQLITCHGLFSVPVQQVLAQVKAFSDANPDEIIVVDFRKLYAMDRGRHEFLIKTLNDTLGPKMASRDQLSPASTCGEFWDKGKPIVVLYDREVSWSQDILVLIDQQHQLWTGQLWSEWPDSQSLDDLKPKLDSYLRDRPGRAANRLFAHQGILTPTVGLVVKEMAHGHNSLADMAAEVTPHVVDWVAEWSDRPMNIAIVDQANWRGTKTEQSIVYQAKRINLKRHMKAP
jgi:hypothetical protein